MKTDYNHFTEKQLKEKMKEITLQVVQSYTLIEKPKTNRENRTRLRREIARIKTEIRKRELENNPKTPL